MHFIKEIDVIFNPVNKRYFHSVAIMAQFYLIIDLCKLLAEVGLNYI